MNTVLGVARRCMDAGTSIFGSPPLVGLDRVWGQSDSPGKSALPMTCAVSIERTEAIEGLQAQARISGVVRFNSVQDRNRATQHALVLSDKRSGQTVSVALFDLGDPLEQLSPKRRHALSMRFSGYTHPLPDGAVLTAQLGDHACSVPVQVLAQH
jgi:hypothetical protein